MQGISFQLTRVLAAFAPLFASVTMAEEAPPATALVISVADQKLALLRDGGLIKKFPISTSKFGLGDTHGSYKTPLGKLRVCDKVGDDLTVGAVLKQRHATGEILAVNAPGRDPIVTRILWLEGLEEQNANARQRGIYIHGTVEESKIGDPVSYGCIRMRSKDVVELFEEVPLDATVTIIPEKLPRFAKYSPPKPALLAAAGGAGALAKKTPTIVAPLVASAKTANSRATAAPEAPLNPVANLAFKGSILDAGLPEGPRIPALHAPPTPAEVPRLSTLTPGLSRESAFALEGIARDLSPIIRAAHMDAATREAAAQSERPAASEEDQPKPRIAFRAGPTEAKP